MREIEFRGKRKDNGEWVCGFYFKGLNDKDYIMTASSFGSVNEYVDYEVDPSTIGQYTGLCDKNGKRIFDGDIVCCVSLENDHNQKGAVTISAIEYFLSNVCLAITHVPYYPLCLTHDIKIIGNIHDNPELMKD